MKITLINTYDSQGGAAKACYRLHRQFAATGHESRMLVGRKTLSEDSTVVELSREFTPEFQEAEQRCDLLSRRFTTGSAPKYFSPPIFVSGVSRHPLVRDADAINVHWVSNLLSPQDIWMMCSLGKPVVWTFHDERPFTGGCHYSHDCTGYMERCENCPQLVSRFAPLPEASLEYASRLINPRTVIATPSEWLASKARQSRLWGAADVVSVPNNIDTKVFCPAEKSDVRRRLNIPVDAIVFLMGAQDLSDQRKGFEVFAQTAEVVLGKMKLPGHSLPDLPIFAAFGQAREELKARHPRVRFLGAFDSEGELAAVYQSADVFVCPSENDNLPNTVMEAMACQTAIVAKMTGGLPEMVEDGVNGWLLSQMDVETLAEVFLSICRDPNCLEDLSRNSRRISEEKYALGLQANAYESIFMTRCNSASCDDHRQSEPRDDRLPVLSHCIDELNSLLRIERAELKRARRKKRTFFGRLGMIRR